MAFSKITTDMNIIAALDDEPNDVGGLSAAQLKAKFDEGGLALKTFINNWIDAIAAGTAAANIGAKDLNDDTTDLQTALDNLAGAVIGTLPDGSVTTAKLHDGAVTDAKIDWTDTVITRIETVSWVGTGDETANVEIAFTHVPKFVIVTRRSDGSGASYYTTVGVLWDWGSVVTQYNTAGAANYVAGIFDSYLGYQIAIPYTLSNGNKTITLQYHYTPAERNLNQSGYTYTAISFY